MIFIGSDHAGFVLKEEIKKHLTKTNLEFKDFGCFSEVSVDYPKIARDVCTALVKTKKNKAILICGTGVGMSIVANKFLDVRAVCASDHFSVKYSRLHNDANVLCIGARVVAKFFAFELVDIFISTEFSKDRHEQRVKQINNMDYNI